MVELLPPIQVSQTWHPWQRTAPANEDHRADEPWLPCGDTLQIECLPPVVERPLIGPVDFRAGNPWVVGADELRCAQVWDVCILWLCIGAFVDRLLEQVAQLIEEESGTVHTKDN